MSPFRPTQGVVFTAAGRIRGGQARTARRQSRLRRGLSRLAQALKRVCRRARPSGARGVSLYASHPLFSAPPIGAARVGRKHLSRARALRARQARGRHATHIEGAPIGAPRLCSHVWLYQTGAELDRAPRSGVPQARTARAMRWPGHKPALTKPSSVSQWVWDAAPRQAPSLDFLRAAHVAGTPPPAGDGRPRGSMPRAAQGSPMSRSDNAQPCTVLSSFQAGPAPAPAPNAA